MSRDTAGQPVTRSGPGKPSTPKATSVPPVPGPDDGAARPATGAAGASTAGAGGIKPASITPAGGKPASGKPTGGKPTGGKPADGKPAASMPASVPPATVKPATGPTPVSETRRPAAGAASPAAAAAASGARETKAPHAVVPEKAPATPPTQKKAPVGPRRVRLAVSRLDPWSVMKLSFLLSVAIGIMIVVASVVFWLVLDGLHVFTQVNDMIVAILGEETKVNILQYVELKRVVSLSTMIAIVDVVLLTALSTIAAFLYNVVAALVGGVHLTLTDE